jgi:uncharacterized PurR-regulated membrane protein YhhQ (DUF165 family)
VTKPALVTLYLAAIVAANLSVSHWGPTASIYNAFIFIGLDLATLDALHDLWRGRLIRNMSLLIATGSLLSWLSSFIWTPEAQNVARIALASAIAFGAAAIADTIAYHLLRHRPWYERVNQSNIVGAAVDSLIFLPVAFGSLLWSVMFAQFCAKVAGGVCWSFVLKSEGLFARRQEVLD